MTVRVVCDNRLGADFPWKSYRWPCGGSPKLIQGLNAQYCLPFMIQKDGRFAAWIVSEGTFDEENLAVSMTIFIDDKDISQIPAEKTGIIFELTPKDSYSDILANARRDAAFEAMKACVCESLATNFAFDGCSIFCGPLHDCNNVLGIRVNVPVTAIIGAKLQNIAAAILDKDTGVDAYLYGVDVDRMNYQKCQNRACAYCNAGACRFFSVFGRDPKIYADKCNSFCRCRR